MSVGQPPGFAGFSDHQLGQHLAELIARQAATSLPFSALFSQLQDLLGADTSRLGPLRDLLGRPSFRQLVGLEPGSVRVGARDALLQELALTYNAAMVGRLAAVLDGCLGLPPGPVPTAARAGSRGGTAGPAAAAPSSRADTPPGSSSGSQPGAPNATSPPQAPFPPVQPQPPAPQPAVTGTNSVSAALIALVSLLSGAVLVGLGTLLVANRNQPGGGATSAPTATASRPATTPAPAAQTADAPATPKSPSFQPPAPSGAWGSAADYKFGQLPGGDHPNSCAFSQTDSSGRTNTFKEQMEFWACRDVGGDAENGYKVVWADGKEITYTFEPDGDGQVVGTNGSTYPMRWRNDSHQGDPIIVIDHQDGAISWIPGTIH